MALAGCADEGAPTTPDDGTPPVDATKTTGGIRGVVVDQAIVPIAGATVRVLSTQLSVETDEEGTFVFSGLEPGTYIVEASHPLYDKQQTSNEVVAGVKTPQSIKIQLTRLISETPYAYTTMFAGYIACSANILVPTIGGVLSEECGEGVGVPGVGRVGGNPDNQAQIDFYVDSADAKTIIAEAVWTPSINVGTSGQAGGFNMGIYTDFSCDPVCDWSSQVDRRDSYSPMYLRNDHDSGGRFDGSDTPLANIDFNEDTRFSTFTWASSEETGVLLQQEFEMYMTSSYFLPLPEEWSFVNGDENPF